MSKKASFIEGDYRPLERRRLTQETCEKWGYQVATHKGKTVQVANYRDDAGRVVGQKVRFPDKTFTVVGSISGVLYGRHLWRDGGRMVVITEGEIDALTVSQLQGNKWPVVSIPNGAQSAKKSIAQNLEWLEQFDAVVLMFDDDAPGRDAVAECAPLFSPGKCKVARIEGFKDASEAHQAGEGKRVIDAMWGAKVYRPDGVVAAEDLVEAASQAIPMGFPWPFETMNQWTYGRRPKEIYAFGAGTGIGKTDLFTQIIAHDVMNGVRCGVLYLEQPNVETLRRIAGKVIGKPLHVPDAATSQEVHDAVDQVGKTGNLFLYDHFGASEWDIIKSRIRFMVVSLGCQHIFLDHLTALVAQEDDEKKALDSIMAELAGQAQELGHTLHFISHLATPEGKPHEEGGRVMIRHFRGSRSIGFWSHFMFGLERNQQADDEDARASSLLRCLKDRLTGRGTGQTLTLRYDRETGVLVPQDAVFDPAPQGDF